MTAASTPSAAVIGSFNYLADAVASSLFRNGQVLTRRDRDGSDTGFVGLNLEARDVRVEDARPLEGPARPTLIASGFESIDAPLSDATIDFLDNETVVRRYYEPCAELVKTASGASRVVAFDHNVRSATGKKRKERVGGGQQVQAPAHVVHGDYTLTSAPQRLRDLTRPATGNDTFRTLLGSGDALLGEAEVERALVEGRFAIINVWRNIAPEPVATHPLALCDARSVRPEHLVVFEIHYADRIGENYFAKHSVDHRWFFYPGLIRDEALLIKQWDSGGALAQSRGGRGDAFADDPQTPCTFSFHSAFADPTTPDDAPDRWSVEVRCAAVYD